MKGKFSHLIGVSIIIGTSLLAGPVYAKDEKKKEEVPDPTPKISLSTKNADKAEQKEKVVDKAALSSQNRAIRSLKRLVKKYKNTAKEPGFLERLSNFYLQSAGIYFRISHSTAQKKQADVNLKQYRNTLRKAISVINQLINKYPRYPNIHNAYFLRGSSYMEVGKKKWAYADFLKVSRDFPETYQAIQSNMNLADMEIEANNHKKAVEFLGKVEKHPESPYYPFALYKLGWSQFNLEAIPTALGYLIKHINYYNNKGFDNLDTSDRAFLEKSYSDITLFYLEGYEKKYQVYKLKRALTYFKSLDVEDRYLGKMAHRFSKLLRAHGHTKGMIDFKNQLLDEMEDHPATLAVLVNVFDFQVNRRYWKEANKTANNMVSFYQNDPEKVEKMEFYANAVDSLLSTANEHQAYMLKNKKSNDVKKYSQPLIQTYMAYTKMLRPTDPQIPGVYNNLGETLFAIKDFHNATGYYRWIVDNWKKEWVGGKLISLDQARIRAIGSRYEVLNQKGIMAKSTKPLPLSADKDVDLNDSFKEWIVWVDRYETEHGLKKKEEQNFAFELNRTLYSKKQIKRALGRFNRFITKYPKSKFSQPSASLVLDTYVASQNWKMVLQVASFFQKNKSLNQGGFTKILKKMTVNTYAKQIQIHHNEKNYEVSYSQSKQCMKSFKKSDRYQDCLFLAAQASLELKKDKEGLGFLGELIRKFPKSANRPKALLMRAMYQEDKENYTQASGDYLAYLDDRLKAKGVKDSDLNPIREKVLLFAWLSGNTKNLQKTLKQKYICTKTLELDCDRYDGLLYLASPGRGGKSLGKKAFKKAYRGPKENRGVWAAVALEHPEKLGFSDRMLVAKIASSHFKDSDFMLQLTLLSTLSKSLPKVFHLNRKALRTYYKVKANEKSITRRVKLISEFEKAGTKVVELP